MHYVLFYLLGLTAAVLSPIGSVKDALIVLEPVTLTALVASLLVPFAGFASTERWQKFVLKYAIVPLFGVYTVILWDSSSLVGIFLLLCATSVHIGYWKSSIHSRQYRLEQFRNGFASSMPFTIQLVSMLNGQGRSHDADKIVSANLNYKQIDFQWLSGILLDIGNSDLSSCVVDEIVRHPVEKVRQEGETFRPAVEKPSVGRPQPPDRDPFENTPSLALALLRTRRFIKLNRPASMLAYRRRD